MGRIVQNIVKGGCFAAAALFSGSTLLAQPDSGRAVSLAPTTKWQLDYAGENCRLVRSFGEGDSRVLLGIEQIGPSDSFSMSLAGNPLAAASRAKKVTLRFGALPAHDDPPFLPGDVEGFGRALFFSSARLSAEFDPEPSNSEPLPAPTRLPAIDIDAAAQAEDITVGYGSRSVTLQTGNLAAPFKALNQCTLDLIGQWGLDPARHTTLTRMPSWTNQAEVTKRIVQSYPRGALRYGRQGVFALRVLVDDQGKVTKCTVIDATINTALDSPACKAMGDAQFEPALDKDGTPMPSFYTTRIVYLIG